MTGYGTSSRIAVLLVLAAMISACGGSSNEVPLAPQPPDPAAFSNPQPVTILGYSGHAMEPFVSRDGRYVFFNNLNDPSVDTNLHWAERIDAVTFQYRGELAGANTSALEGVPSMDQSSVFYFISTRSYAQSASTVYRGSFMAQTLSGVELVPGVSRSIQGQVNFDAEISPDGNTLYFVDSEFGASGPRTADIVLAERQGSAFVRPTTAALIMQQINTDALEYAPTISASGLELLFTRLEGSTPAIWFANRESIAAQFNPPTKLQAITGFVEAPCLSLDGKSLYYHRRDDGLFKIYRATRP